MSLFQCQISVHSCKIGFQRPLIIPVSCLNRNITSFLCYYPCDVSLYLILDLHSNELTQYHFFSGPDHGCCLWSQFRFKCLLMSFQVIMDKHAVSCDSVIVFFFPSQAKHSSQFHTGFIYRHCPCIYALFLTLLVSPQIQIQSSCSLAASTWRFLCMKLAWLPICMAYVQQLRERRIWVEDFICMCQVQPLKVYFLSNRRKRTLGNKRIC